MGHQLHQPNPRGDGVPAAQPGAPQPLDAHPPSLPRRLVPVFDCHPPSQPCRLVPVLGCACAAALVTVCVCPARLACSHVEQVVRDAVTGQKGIGATFQKLREAEDSLYREVDQTLCRGESTAPAQTSLPGSGGAGQGRVAEESQDKNSHALGPVPAPGASAVPGLPAPALRAGFPSHALGDPELQDMGDPELQDALSILEEAIQVIQSDALSVYSEMTAASSRGAPVLAGGPLPPSAVGEATLAVSRPVASDRKRWWKFLGGKQKLKPVGE